MQRDYTYDPDKIFDALEQAAEEMCNAQYDADLLTELQKPTLAAITLRKIGNEKKPITTAEREALADPEYDQHIRGMVAAQKIANRAKAKYRNYQALAEARRTEQASMRQLTR